MTVIQSLQNFSDGQSSGGGGGSTANSFSVSPSATPIGATWVAGTDPDINITTGDITLTAQGSYTITAYIWGAGGTNSPLYPAGAGGFASGTFTGTTGDILVVKSNFGKGGPPANTGGGAYGIFTTSFAHANSRLIAGGGGGSGFDDGGRGSFGGGGGGPTGANSGGYPTTPAGGGTQSTGGSGGGSPLPGTSGSALQGGTGGNQGTYYGGGGGGGYYGGGGGGMQASWAGSGGGGGSGYVHPSLTNPVNNQASPNSQVAPSPAGASPLRGPAGNPGQPGRIYITG